MNMGLKKSFVGVIVSGLVCVPAIANGGSALNTQGVLGRVEGTVETIGGPVSGTVDFVEDTLFERETHSVPELSAGSAGSALALVGFGLLLLTSQRRRRDDRELGGSSGREA
jgi:hypothetical protein